MIAEPKSSGHVFVAEMQLSSEDLEFVSKSSPPPIPNR
jgi:hypothetical protein